MSTSESIALFGVIVSLIVALIAMLQSLQTIRISNKQFLYTERMRLYKTLLGMLDLFDEHYRLLIDRPVSVKSFDTLFRFMTNNAYLHDMGHVLSAGNGTPEHKVYLSKLSDLNNLAEEAKLLFNGTISTNIYLFLLDYTDLLSVLYKGHLLVGSMKEYDRNPNYGDNKEPVEIYFKDILDPIIDDYTDVVISMKKYSDNINRSRSNMLSQIKFI